MTRAVLAAILVASLLAPAAAASDGRSVRIHLTIADRAELAELTRLASVDDVRGLEVWAYATPRQQVALAKAGYSFEVVPESRDERLLATCSAGWDTNPSRPWDCYPTYAQYVGLLQYECGQHASICRLHDLGPTTSAVHPHRLWAVEITDNPDADEDEPEVLFASTIHGDEVTGYMLMLRLLDELLDGHGSDPEVTAMVEGLEIWVNPLHNPDGTYFGGDSSVSSAIREYTTASGGYGADGNRNFPDPDDGPHPDGEPYWLETQTMMGFAGSRHFVISANFHGGAEVVNYPWDTWARLHSDNGLLVNVSRAYADYAHADGPAGYLTDLDDGITNGYAWYEVTGGHQDYMTYFHGSREATIEVSSDKMPASSSMPTFWAANRRALHGWLTEALEGVRGVVTSSAGGPLDATVEVVGVDAAVDNSYAHTDPAVGDYHRMLLPGTYTLRFSAYGHQTQDVANVVVGSGAATRRDVVLQQLPSAGVTGTVTTPGGKGSLAGATVEVVGTPVTPATTGADGGYAFASVVAGTYAFRVSAPGYATVEVERTVAAPATVLDFALAPYQVALATDLEGWNGGLVATPSTNGWEWGAPSGSGNPGAHSPTRVWATNLEGDYVDDADWYLDLSLTLPASSPRLSFWHWYYFESGNWDGGNVSLSTNNGSSWTLLTPDGGYPSADVSALDQPGYAGSSGAWVAAGFDLSAWAGAAVKLRWHFASDGSQTELGWYLDDLQVTGASNVAAFDWAPAAPTPGETVQLADRSTGPVSSWAWSFGDGGTATVQRPQHVFANGGSYLVSLEVTYPGGATLSHLETVEVGGGDDLFSDGFESGSTGAWSGTTP